MTTKKTKLLSAVAAASLVAGMFSLLPGTVANAKPGSNHDSQSVSIGDKPYNSLADAIKRAKSGDIITLDCDKKGEFKLGGDTIKFPDGNHESDLAVTLDLGECTVVDTGNPAFEVTSGSLKLTNGTIKDDKKYTAISVKGDSKDSKGKASATVTVDSTVSFVKFDQGIVVDASANGAVVNTSGKVGSITVEGAAPEHGKYTAPVINITGGTAGPLFGNAAATWKITGGTVSPVTLAAGSLNMTGGTIKGEKNATLISITGCGVSVNIGPDATLALDHGKGTAIANNKDDCRKSPVSITVDPKVSLTGIYNTSIDAKVPVYHVTFVANFPVDKSDHKDKDKGKDKDKTPAGPVDQYIFTGNLVGEPTVTYDGYLFVGWYMDNKKFKDQFDFAKAVDAKGNFAPDKHTDVTQEMNVTLYGKWVPAATITFDLNGGKAEGVALTQVVAVGATPSYPAATKDGCTPEGWKDAAGVAWDANTKVKTNAAVTLTAQWECKAAPATTAPGSKGPSIYTGGSVTSTGFAGLAAVVLLVCAAGALMVSRRRVVA